MTTPTPLDTSWLQQQLRTALAAAGANTAIVLPRAVVEQALNTITSPAPAAAMPFSKRYTFSNEELYCAVLAELVRLADGDEAPSKGRWDQQRSRLLPSAQHICHKLDVSWKDLVLAAGLVLNRHASYYYKSEEDDAPGEPCKLPDNDPLPDHGLAVASARTEVFGAAGTVTTRTYYMLR